MLAAAIDYETALPRGLIREEHAAIAERLDDALLDSGLQEAEALADETVSSALADGDAAIGWPEVAESVVRHLVGHLIVGAEAALDPAVLDPYTQAALGWPSPQMLVERAVGQAVISGAEVTVLPANAPALIRAEGAAATVRY